LIVNVILLDRIQNLGQLGEQVKVKPGYARNYLLPQGKAVLANARNMALFETKRAELEKELVAKMAQANQRAAQLEALQIVIPVLVGDEGKLYGSVTATEIVAAVRDQGIEAAKQEVHLPNGPIRLVGNYVVEFHLHHGDVVAKVNVSVVQDK